MRLRWFPILLCGVLFIVGALGGWVAHSFFGTPSMIRGSVLRQGGYTFINPILACEIGPEDSFYEFKPIQAKIEAVIASRKSAGEEISVYLRRLKSGRYFDIHPDTKYAPASLMKVIIMMAYYRDAEEHPQILKKKFTFTGRSDRPNAGTTTRQLNVGQQYTAEELIRYMIIHSDNDAMDTLVDGFEDSTLRALKSIYSDLAIPSPLEQKEDALEFMSVERYSILFRVLFSSTLLTREYSEKALQLLSEAEYREGLAAGVPEGTIVSHKFGVKQTGSVVELHDCGIIYYPDHPYLLCIMTKGGSLAALQESIKDISRETYQLLDMFYKNQQQTGLN